MKKLIILGAFILTAGLLNAQTQTKKVNQRQKNQTTRIAKGAKSGELTKKETKQLARQQRDIRKTKRNAKSDGVVTKKRKSCYSPKAKCCEQKHQKKKEQQQKQKLVNCCKL